MSHAQRQLLRALVAEHLCRLELAAADVVLRETVAYQHWAALQVQASPEVGLPQVKPSLQPAHSYQPQARCSIAPASCDPSAFAGADFLSLAEETSWIFAVIFLTCFLTNGGRRSC